jgi:hypothetical protein
VRYPKPKIPGDARRPFTTSRLCLDILARMNVEKPLSESSGVVQLVTRSAHSTVLSSGQGQAMDAHQTRAGRSQATILPYVTNLTDYPVRSVL